MRNKKETIRKFVSIVNNEEEQGGLWLLNIQRYFIWEKRTKTSGDVRFCQILIKS